LQYLDFLDVVSNSDGRTDDLMANDLRIVDCAPAGAHRVLRGELVPRIYLAAGIVGTDQVTRADTTVQNLDIDVLFIPLLGLVLLPFELSLD